MVDRTAAKEVASVMSRRAVLIGGAMAATAGSAFAMRPRAAASVSTVKLGPLIPGRIGMWRYVGNDGLVVARPEEDETGPSDGYDQLVTRVYSAPQRPTIMLLLAYGAAQGGGLQLHRPETCYPGQGFVLRDFSDVALQFPGSSVDVRSRRFTAVRDERAERLIYWTRVGRHFPKTTFEEYRAILAGALEGAVSDGLLVRLSTIEPDTSRADAALIEFAQALVAAAHAEGRRMLVGNAAV